MAWWIVAARRPVPHPPCANVDLVFTIAYNGTRFQGFQWQPPLQKHAHARPEKRPRTIRTVEGTLTEALSRLGLASAVSTVSRTDSGVSAREHLCWARLPFSAVEGRPSAESDIASQLNAALPEDVRVVRVKVVRPSQVNIKSATIGKEYVYHLSWGAWAGVAHLQPFAQHLRAPLDVDAMRAALVHVVGTHDFGAFLSSASQRPRPRLRATEAAADCAIAAGAPGVVLGDADADDSASVASAASASSSASQPSTVRTVWAAELTLLDPKTLSLGLGTLAAPHGGAAGAAEPVELPTSTKWRARDASRAASSAEIASGLSTVLRFSIQGDGFMKHQVRRFVGALTQVGHGTLPVTYFRDGIIAAEAAAAAVAAAAAAADVSAASTVVEAVRGPCDPGRSHPSDGSPAARVSATSGDLAAFRSHGHAAPGRGLCLQRTLLPDTFWTDPDWCNNSTPGYCAQWALTLQQ